MKLYQINYIIGFCMYGGLIISVVSSLGTIASPIQILLATTSIVNLMAGTFLEEEEMK